MRAALLPREPLAGRAPGEQVQARATKLGSIQELLGADLPGVGHKGAVAQVVLIGVDGLGVEVEGGAKLEA